MNAWWAASSAASTTGARRLDVRDVPGRIVVARLGAVDRVAEPRGGSLASVVGIGVVRRAAGDGGRRDVIAHPPAHRARPPGGPAAPRYGARSRPPEPHGATTVPRGSAAARRAVVAANLRGERLACRLALRAIGVLEAVALAVGPRALPVAAGHAQDRSREARIVESQAGGILPVPAGAPRRPPAGPSALRRIGGAAREEGRERADGEHHAERVSRSKVRVILRERGVREPAGRNGAGRSGLGDSITSLLATRPHR